MRAKVAGGLTCLEGCPRELFFLYACKLFEAFGYFSLSMLYTLLLTERYGFSDYDAGVSYGVWGALIVGFNLLLAPLIDSLGVRKCLLVSFSLSAIARLALVLSPSKLVMFCAMYGILPMASALGVPVMVIGVKRYTSHSARAFGFGVFYAIMNLAALGNGIVFDFFHARASWKKSSGGAVVNDGLLQLVLLGGVTSLMGLATAFFMREDAQIAEQEGQGTSTGCKDHEETRIAGDMNLSDLRPLKLPHEMTSGHAREHCHKPLQSIMAVAAEMHSLLKTERARKFMTVAIFTINLRQMFRHLDATLPKYELRAFGCQVPVGWIYSINPIMIISLVPVVSSLTTTVNHFDMIHAGSYIAALSSFWMVASQSVSAVILFVISLSLGEAVWSPRWYEYSMWIAPNGKEGIYTALSAAPLFLAKVQTGVLSGFLLEKYCPNNYQCQQGNPPKDFVPRACDGQRLWLIVGCITLISPLGLSLLSRWLRPTDSELLESDSLNPKKSGKYESLA